MTAEEARAEAEALEAARGWVAGGVGPGVRVLKVLLAMAERGASREVTEAEVEAARVELYMGDSRVDTARIRAALVAAREVRS